MKKLITIYLLFISLFAYCQNNNITRPDGPYIIYSNNSIKEIKTDKNGRLIINDIPGSGKIKFSTISNNSKTHFNFYLHDFQREQSRIEAPDKIFVLSDPHGDIDNFISLLKSAGVITNKLKWKFGKNHLVILGDVADRGADVTSLYWLIYKLESEAVKAGGTVHYIIGNHDNMLLKGDTRYTNKKYNELSDRLSISQKDLYGKNSELGTWLRSKNTLQIIGNTLFVHGGINKTFANQYSVNDFDKINLKISQNLDLPKQSLCTDILFLFETDGPIWYRGLILDTDKYNPSTEDEVNSMLEKFKIKRIVVGHTTMKSTTFRHNEKVIAIDCETEQRDHLSSGIMITGELITVIKNK